MLTLGKFLIIADFSKESSRGVCFKDFTTYATRYSHVAIIPNVIVVDIPLIIDKVISIGDVNHGLQRIGIYTIRLTIEEEEEQGEEEEEWCIYHKHTKFL